jgi:hypothetical protein
LDRNRSRSKSISKLVSSQVPLGQSTPESYLDVDARRQKLTDLKELMRRELLAAKAVGATKPNPDVVEQAIQGYPSFMKAPRIREQFKVQSVTESEILEFKKSVHKILEQKVKKEDMHDQDESSIDTMELELEVEHDLATSRHQASSRKEGETFEEHLYPLDTTTRVLPLNQADSRQYDFHQRKSKEIRRIQYASENRKKNAAISRVASKEKLEQLKADHQEVEDVVPTTYAGKAREKRTHPDEGYPVWARIPESQGSRIVPALLKNTQGFKINPQTDTMEVIEKDRVTVNPRDGAKGSDSFKVITGRVERPNKSKDPNEEDCEIVVQDKEGKRTAILFFEREPEEQSALIEPEPERHGRVMEEANCRAFDVLGKFLGRGKLALQDVDPKTGSKVRYAKGILINSEEKIEFVLAKFLDNNKASLKRKNLGHTDHNVEEEEDMEITGHDVKCLTLSDVNKNDNPELLFILNDEYHPQKDNLLTQEEATCELEDYRLFEGELQYEDSPGDREGILWLLLTKAKEAKDARTMATRKSTIGFEKIRIELDDIDPNQDIINILDRIKMILDSRKRAAENARLEREKQEKEEKERREKEAAAKALETRKLMQSELAYTEDPRASKIHGNRRMTREVSQPIGAIVDFIVNCPDGQKLHIFLGTPGQSKEIDSQVQLYYEDSDKEQPAQEGLGVIYNGQEYKPTHERRAKKPLKSAVDHPWEIRVIQPFEEPAQREHELKEIKRQAPIEEYQERSRRLRDEDTERRSNEKKRPEDEEELQRRKLEDEEKERLRRLEEEEEKPKRSEEKEMLRVLPEEQEREYERKIQEEEYKPKIENQAEKRDRDYEDEVRSQKDEDEVRSQKDEDEVRSQKDEDEVRSQKEVDEIKRIEHEDELRIQREEAETRPIKEEEELRNSREEEAIPKILRESQERKDDEEKKRQAELEKQRQLEEIENTQRKVKELKEALERSRVGDSQEIPVIKKSNDIVTNNRYRDSVDSDAPSRKLDFKPTPEEPKEVYAEEPKQMKKSDPKKPVNSKDPKQRFSVIQPRTSPLIDFSKNKAPAKKEESKSIKYEPKQPEKQVEKSSDAPIEEASDKSSSKKSLHTIRSSNYTENRSNVQSFRIQESNDAVIPEGEKMTKIELNLENSQDDINFVGYGQLRYNNKKNSSKSPSMLKDSFARVSPDREVVMNKDKNLTTRPFTPFTSEKKPEYTKKVAPSTDQNGPVVAQHVKSQELNSSQQGEQVAPRDATREEQVIFYLL